MSRRVGRLRRLPEGGRAMATFVTFTILCAVAAAVVSFVKHRKEYGRN